jgi:hypothetical protein
MRKGSLLAAGFLLLALGTSANGLQGTPAVQGWVNGSAQSQGAAANNKRTVKISGSYYTGRPANSNQDNLPLKITITWEQKQWVQVGPKQQLAWVSVGGWDQEDALLVNANGTYSFTQADLEVKMPAPRQNENYTYRACVSLYVVGKALPEATTYVEYTPGDPLSP